MSELKGTLLTIVLTLILFATVSTCLTTSFNNLSKKAQDQITEVVSESK